MVLAQVRDHRRVDVRRCVAEVPELGVEGRRLRYVEAGQAPVQDAGQPAREVVRLGNRGSVLARVDGAKPHHQGLPRHRPRLPRGQLPGRGSASVHNGQ